MKKEKEITTSQTGIFLAKQGVSTWRGEQSGITLIALVITVIVLLILAGTAVSIGLNGGNIFERANQAKSGWNKKVAEEDIELHNYVRQIGNYVSTPDEDDNTEYPLASTVLKVNYTGMTPAAKSPYVNYHYKDNEEDKTILCRVLYDAESEYGIQIISNDSIDNIELGINGDAYFIQNDDYNNAVTILNTKAGHYLNESTIAESARSVGSNPNSTEISEGTTSMLTINEYNGSGQYKDKDDEYLTDMNQMSQLGITASVGHWLASRTYYLQGNYRMGVRISTSLNEGEELVRLYMHTADEYIRYFSKSSGFRPVFHLKSGLKVKSGNGTEKLPYELSL